MSTRQHTHYTQGVADYHYTALRTWTTAPHNGLIHECPYYRGWHGDNHLCVYTGSYVTVPKYTCTHNVTHSGNQIPHTTTGAGIMWSMSVYADDDYMGARVSKY